MDRTLFYETGSEAILKMKINLLIMMEPSLIYPQSQTVASGIHAWLLTHWDRDKMDAIFTDGILICIFLNDNV